VIPTFAFAYYPMLAIFERHHDEILRQCSSACETFIFHCELMLTAYILVQFRTQMVNIIRKIYGLLHPFSSELFNNTGLTWLGTFFPRSFQKFLLTRIKKRFH